MTFQVIGKVAIGRAIFKHQNEQIFLFQLYFLDIGDVENTTIERNDTFINTINYDEPDPAIVNLKIKKESNITDWPGLEDGGIATDLS